MCCRGNTLGSVGLSRLCKCLLDLCLCLGLGEPAGPTGHGSLSLLLTLPSVSSLGEHLSLYLVMLHWDQAGALNSEVSLAGWELSWSCCRPEQRCMWALGCEHWAAPVHPLQFVWIFSSWLPASREWGWQSAVSQCMYFFLLVMQCSASLDVLFLLDGSYSIGKGSFERSKHFAGKLCDALDIHPDRVSVRNISSNFQTAQQCV